MDRAERPRRTAADWAVLAWKVVWVLAMVALAAVVYLQPAGAAQEPVPDYLLRDRADRLVTLYVRTRTCMLRAGDAAFRHLPDASAARAQHFMVSACADPLRLELQRDGMGEDQARCVLARLARTTYYEDVLRVLEPAVKPGDAVTCDPSLP